MRKNAVITGVNRGIGKAILQKFAAEGYVIWACARKKSDDFENIIKEFNEKFDTTIHACYFDLENKEETIQGIKQIISEAKTIDVLINNAGISSAGMFLMTPDRDYEKMMDINFFKPLLLCQLVGRMMVRKKSGSIINIASVSGINNEEGGMAYGASKAALLFATKTMAIELGRYGIRVNAVSPGFIYTDMWKAREEKLYNETKERTPLRRIGQAEEVAELVAFLASDKASYITGQNYIIDGGGRV